MTPPSSPAVTPPTAPKPKPKPKASRNTAFVVEASAASYTSAIRAGLVQATLQARDDKRVTLMSGQTVTEFVSCSYLGLDVHPDVIAGAKRVLDDFGVHLCCARSRFSMGPNDALEEGLSELFGGRAITFPSVTSAHQSVLPLIASGVLLGVEPGSVRLVFDRYAHASMQFLRPILAVEASVTTIPHNDLDALAAEVDAAEAAGQAVVYLADGVYSMGGRCPIEPLLEMARDRPLWLYIDDAHGTSIFGERGEGYVSSRLPEGLPPNVFFNFSLAKGFGCNGGGVCVPGPHEEHLVRSFGQTYAFSGPLDFSIQGAALAALDLHRSGLVRERQAVLRERVATFDALRPGLASDGFTPIRMVPAGAEDRAIRMGEALLARGYFVTVAFFPVVPRGRAQLRIALSAAHTEEDVRGLCVALREVEGAVV